MGGSQSQETTEPAGGTSPVKSPAAAPASGGAVTTDAGAAQPPAAVPKPVGESKGVEKSNKTPSPGTQICVQNLGKDAKAEDLRQKFEGFGSIVDVSLETQKNGQGKGFGFVTFATQDEAKKAIEAMNQKKQPDGKPLLVTLAQKPGEVKSKKEPGEKGEKGKGKGWPSPLPPGMIPSSAAPSAPSRKTAGAGEKPKKETPGTQICVRNVAKDAKEEDLRKQFEGFGKITEVSLKTLKNGQGKGYGFVTFATLKEAKKAIEAMHGKPTPDGKTLLVTMATRQAAEPKGKGKDGGGEKGDKGKGKGSQICVRNLAKDAKEEDLRKLFQGFGKITDVALKTLPDGQGKGYGFVTFTTLQEAHRAIEAMHEKAQPGGKPLLVTMGTRQPGDAKGKGKDGGEKGDKGKGKGSEGKGKAEPQPGAVAYQPQMLEGAAGAAGAVPAALPGQFGAPLGYYPYSQEQIQNAWAVRMQYYQQALQAQAYYSGFTGGVVPQAAMASAPSMRESPAPAPAAPTWNREYAAPVPSPAPAAPPPAPAWGKEYIGQVKSISSKNGYGFITCNETKAAYGRDVFVDAALLPEIEVKAKVSFTMELSAKGHPRAIKVTKIADAED